MPTNRPRLAALAESAISWKPTRIKCGFLASAMCEMKIQRAHPPWTMTDEPGGFRVVIPAWITCLTVASLVLHVCYGASPLVFLPTFILIPFVVAVRDGAPLTVVIPLLLFVVAFSIWISVSVAKKIYGWRGYRIGKEIISAGGLIGWVKAGGLARG